MFSKLQYISKGINAAEHIKNIEEALHGGCRWIQLRMKNIERSELLAIAPIIKERCKEYKAILIINDYPDIAAKVKADGVHLGLLDMPVKEARGILGDKIIGGTANTLEDVLTRVQEGCDYIGLGPYRFTPTKEKLSPVLGVEGYNNIITELQKRNINPKLYAIGGVTLSDVEQIMRAGVYGIAVSDLISAAPDKPNLIEQLNLILYEPHHCS